MSKISLILWEKANTEAVWVFLIRNFSQKEKLNCFRYLENASGSKNLDVERNKKIIEKKLAKPLLWVILIKNYLQTETNDSIFSVVEDEHDR